MDAAIFGLIVADLIAELMDPASSTKARRIGAASFSLAHDRRKRVQCRGSAMAKLGMSVASAGMVGKDVLGRGVLEQLVAAGVDTSCVITSDDAQTSATVVAVEPDGERCFFHNPGVSNSIDSGVFRKCFDLFRTCAPGCRSDISGCCRRSRPICPTCFARTSCQRCPGTKVALGHGSILPADWKLLEPILPDVDLFAPESQLKLRHSPAHRSAKDGRRVS